MGWMTTRRRCQSRRGASPFPTTCVTRVVQNDDMDQRISLITLGIRDLARARAFYEALGWRSGTTNDDVVFFQAGGMVLALWDRTLLAEDSGVSDAGGWGGVTLAYNVASSRLVDDTLTDAARAGATIARPGAPTFWGGYSGVFIDPDGHPWEVAHNPDWPLDQEGRIHLP
jgi:catechol 2,3-dioxygenase-like lactoylglutathione lyase family enzyme